MASRSSPALGGSDSCNALDSVAFNSDGMSDNELIAEFMGIKKVRVGYFGVKRGDNLLESETKWQVEHTDWLDKVGLNEVGTYAVNIDDDYWIPWKEVNYKKSWEWLMHVVNKIESVLSTPDASVMVGWDHWNDQFDGTINTDIEVTYQIVIEFIKWYNKTPKP